MMPRKKRIAVISIISILVVAVIGIVVAVLYINTDLFKSNETLFYQYLFKNLEVVNKLSNQENTNIRIYFKSKQIHI